MATRAGRPLADISPLRESPAFRRLWVGSTLSAVGGALTMFAVPLQVYDITRSPFAVGAIGVAQVVPTVTIGLLGGALADAADRRKLVLVVSSCSAAVSAGLAAQAFAGLRSVWLLYALVAVSSSFSAINAPARRTFIPSLLPADQLTAGLALAAGARRRIRLVRLIRAPYLSSESAPSRSGGCGSLAALTRDWEKEFEAKPRPARKCQTLLLA
jgi:MFS family permease